MGIIQDVQGNIGSMNRQERIRREHQRIKILQENYKKEIYTNLTAEFYSIYRQYDTQTAYNTIVLQEDEIIEKIYNIISKITHLENDKKCYTYSNFDIMQDLADNYYTVLEKVKKKIDAKYKIERDRLIELLRHRLEKYMCLDEDKYFLALSLQKHEILNEIIEEITGDNQLQMDLKQSYNKVLNEVLKGYKGDIAINKMKIQQQKDIARQKEKNKIEKWLFFNYSMSGLLKTLPKPHNKKKKY